MEMAVIVKKLRKVYCGKIEKSRKNNDRRRGIIKGHY